MQLDAWLRSGSLALSDGSMYERLRRDPAVRFDPHLAHASLIYHPPSAAVLERLHREYLDIGQRHRLPMVTVTDTWRASAERIAQSVFAGRPVNEDNARFLRALRDSYGPDASPIWIGGQMGPRGNAYRPEEALAPEDARRYHAPQIEALASAGVDFVIGATLPAISEARGIGEAMAATGTPFVLSFVIRGTGALLDGTPLADAIASLDALPRAPLGYGVNCVHPSAYADAIDADPRLTAVAPRIVWFQANASARDPRELDSIAELDVEDPAALAAGIWRARQKWRTPVVGGCCGTDVRHIEQLAEICRRARR